MRSFAEYLHTRGMQLGVYTDAGKHNCCGEPGSLGYEELDMKTFASWGADGVGVDYCGGPPDVQAEYQKYVDGIVKSGSNMSLGVFNLGRGLAYTWVPAMSRNLTQSSKGRSQIGSARLTGDIGNYWSGKIPPTMSVMSTVDKIQGIADLWSYGMGNESGVYPNYGQMDVGVPRDHPTIGDPGLTLVEAQSHFSMWAMFPAPLSATHDVRLRDPDIERILLNKETIAINQDPWGLPAFSTVSHGCAGQRWARRLANGDLAALILNRDNTSVRTRLDFSELSNATAPGGSYQVRDVQNNKDLGVACAHVGFELEAHQTAFVRLTKVADTCTPAPPPQCTAPRPPGPPPAPPSACQHALEADGCLAGGQSCLQCAQAHQKDMAAAGCTVPAVKALCGKAQRPL